MPHRMNQTVYVLLHETVLQSWLKDVVTFSSIAAMTWVNHAYASGSILIDTVGAAAVIGVVFARSYRNTETAKRFTLEELRLWALQEPGLDEHSAVEAKIVGERRLQDRGHP